MSQYPSENLPHQAFTIVAADDSPLYRKLLHDTLARQKFSVYIAKNGREALALVAHHRPAVLVSDWEMPDITGPELCAQVRSDGDNYIHIILLTSHNDKEKVIKGLAAGADDYLTKPFHEGELLARVAVGIRIAELHREIHAKNKMLEELARTDPLTSLPNRRALEEWASRAICGAQRHGFRFWLIMADLDHFKSINDRFGHETGDTVLRRFGEIIKSLTRSADMCARLGGEEFVIAVSHVDREGINIFVERLRRRLETECFEYQGTEFNVTASFGVAGFDKQLHDFSQLLREADAALYRAKEGGRNRAGFAQSLEPQRT